MMENLGKVFDIQRTSFVDGPGLRTTVFFKGCNLRCKWCHNPEGISPNRQLVIYKEKCTDCGACKAVCKNEPCILCGECERTCRNGARRIVGREYTSDQLLGIIKSDKPFYSTGGGVTFSGGECMLQSDFISELAKKCFEENIDVAIDTAGNVPYDRFLKVLPYTEMFLYDIKCISEDLHREFVGSSNKLILENIRKISETGKRIWIRIPTIPSFNANEDEMQKIADFLKDINTEKIELLPYHMTGASKARAMGFEAEEFSVPSDELIAKLRAIIDTAKS